MHVLNCSSTNPDYEPVNMISKADLDFMPETYAAEVESVPIALHAVL